MARAQFEARAKAEEKRMDYMRKKMEQLIERSDKGEKPKDTDFPQDPSGYAAAMKRFEAGGAGLTPQQKMRAFRALAEAESIEDLDFDKIMKIARGEEGKPGPAAGAQDLFSQMPFGADIRRVGEEMAMGGQDQTTNEDLRRMAGALEGIPAGGGQPPQSTLGAVQGSDLNFMLQQLGLAPPTEGPEQELLQTLLLQQNPMIGLPRR
jgi:hypothetical protein